MQFHSAFPLRRKPGWAFGAFALLFGAVTPALAHHSYAMFDSSKTMEVKGTVKKVVWTNPHSFFIVSVRDPSGQTVDHAFEGGGPGALGRSGWTRDSLKPGDIVTVTAQPMRDGGPGGNLLEVTLADGQKLSTRGAR